MRDDRHHHDRVEPSRVRIEHPYRVFPSGLMASSRRRGSKVGFLG